MGDCLDIIDLIVKSCLITCDFTTILELGYVNRSWNYILSQDSTWKYLLFKYFDMPVSSTCGNYKDYFVNLYRKEYALTQDKSGYEYIRFGHLNGDLDVHSAIQWYFDTEQIQLKYGTVIYVTDVGENFLYTDEICNGPIKHDFDGDSIYQHADFVFPKFPLAYWSNIYNIIRIYLYDDNIIDQVIANLDGEESYFEYKAIKYEVKVLNITGAWYYNDYSKLIIITDDMNSVIDL